MRMAYGLLSVAVAAMVTSQLLIKLGMSQAGHLPSHPLVAVVFLIRNALESGQVLVGIIFAIVGAMAYLAALTKLRLSTAYPFMALTYVLVFAGAGWILREDISVLRWIGIILICGGVALSGQGKVE